MLNLKMDYYAAPDVYEFRLFGSDWDLIVFSTSFGCPDESLKYDAWIRIKNYGYMQHVVGVSTYYDFADCYDRFIDSLEVSVRESCLSYISVMDENGWW